MDLYTKGVLTIIALALVAIAVRVLPIVSVAHAGSDTACRITGPIEVKVTSAPEWPVGTWNGRPLFVKQIQ